MIVRRHIDEVTFQVSKQLKDRLRLVQRISRDHFGSMAEELHRSLSEALARAKQAAADYTADNDEHVAVLRVRLAEVERLRALIPESEPPGDGDVPALR